MTPESEQRWVVLWSSVGAARKLKVLPNPCSSAILLSGAGSLTQDEVQVNVSKLTTSRGAIQFSVDAQTWQRAFDDVLRMDDEEQLQGVWSEGEESLSVVARTSGAEGCTVGDVCRLLAMRYRDGLDDGILIGGQPAVLPDKPAVHHTGLCKKFSVAYKQAMLEIYSEQIFEASPPGMRLTEPILRRGKEPEFENGSVPLVWIPDFSSET